MTQGGGRGGSAAPIRGRERPDEARVPPSERSGGAAPGDDGPDRARPPARPGPRWRWALAGVLVAAAGLALVYGSSTPAVHATDEGAHLAYAELIREGRLPDIDTLKPAARARVAAGAPPEAGDYVYVANHPPLFAAVHALAAAAAEAAGVDGAERPVGRALNALAMVGATAVAGALGRELTGSPRLAVLGAGAFAAVPSLWSVASFAYSDGLATLATGLVAWAGLRAWRRPGVGPWLALGAAAALAGASRASALGAAAAVGLVVVVRVVARSPRRWADGARAALCIGSPAVALTAWWYARNWARVGDPVGSEVLNARLGRPPRAGGLAGRLVDLGMWREMLAEAWGTVYSAHFGPPRPRLATGLLAVLGVVAVGALLGLLRPARPGPGGVPGSGRRGVAGGPVLVAAVAAVVVGVANHTASGGSPHPRYLYPALVVLCPLLVAGLDRWHPVAAVAAVGAAAATSLALVGPGLRWVTDHATLSGQELYGPGGWRAAGLVLVGVGLAGAVGAGTGAARADRRARR